MAKTKVDESPMMKQFRELKEKHPDALLLFRCGDFYETYDGDAKACAKVLGITLTKREDTGMAMAGFPYHALDTYLPKLVRAANSGKEGYKRIAICDQLDPMPPKPKRKGGDDDNQSTSTNLKSSTTMAKKNQANESKNAAQQQVNNEMQSVSVGEVTLDSILPTMQAEPAAEPTKQEVAQAISKAATEGTATTMPLGSHGTLVIAGVGGGEKPKREKGSTKFDLEKPVPRKFDLEKDKGDEPISEEQPAEEKPKVTLRKKTHLTFETYDVPCEVKTKGGKTKTIQRTHARIVGFQGTEDVYQREVAQELHASPYPVKVKSGERVPALSFSPRYAEFARRMFHALQDGATIGELRQMLATYDAERAEKKAEWKQKRTDYLAKREERKQERAARQEAKGAATAAAQQPTQDSDGYAAQMIEKLMSGQALPKNIMERLNPEVIKVFMAKAA